MASFGILDPGTVPMARANYTAISAGTDLPESLGSFYLELAERERAEAEAAELAARGPGILTDQPVQVEGFVAATTAQRLGLGL